jgi:hypothetical protein
MRIFDAFPFHDELDMLECRLTELETIPNLVHVIVEADVTHQDDPKPLYFLEHRERFAAWKDRIIHVSASGLPTRAAAPDPWAREYAQREWIGPGLHAGGAEPGDIVLQSDVDEIPTVTAARNVRPSGLVSFEQRGHFWAVDWLYPLPWYGTVAARVSTLLKSAELNPADSQTFGAMRGARNTAPKLPAAGWHLSWLGGAERALHKVGAFCHPEVEDRIRAGLKDDGFMRDGWHVDGQRLVPVDVDRTWPRYVYERRCPESWWRPR